ncbi:Arc family DNA-binding protein [Enterobacter hormaechei]
MARDDPQFNLRMTQELKEMIANRAKSNGRSMNTEIIHTLIDSFSEGIREDADNDASRLVVMYRDLRNKLPANEEELIHWNEKMLNVSFYLMKKLSSYANNYELLKSLKEEAETHARGLTKSNDNHNPT